MYKICRNEYNFDYSNQWCFVFCSRRSRRSSNIPLQVFNLIKAKRDWQRILIKKNIKRTVILDKLAEQIEKLSKKSTTQFQIALGDNMYLQGVTDVNDERFKVNFVYYFKVSHIINNYWLIYYEFRNRLKKCLTEIMKRIVLGFWLWVLIWLYLIYSLYFYNLMIYFKWY